MVVTQLTFASLGLEVVGHGRRRTYDADRYRSLFGCSPFICLKLWELLVWDGAVFRDRVQPKHLLWALFFIKLYLPVRSSAAIVDCDEKTFCKWVLIVLEAISQADGVISWEYRRRGFPVGGNGVGGVCRISVDGTDFRINEPRPFSPRWYSHKFKGPGLRYEVGISIRTGWIVWINGPFPCGTWSDLKIFKAGLLLDLDPGEKVVADGGYPTNGLYTIIPRLLVGDREKRMHAMIRARHEIINRRFKQWQILGAKYRSGLDGHGTIFWAVAVITQVILKEESIPFNPAHFF